MNRLVVIALAGCTEPHASLADLGPLVLDFEYGVNFLAVDIRHEHEPCPVLGDDFHAFVAREPAQTFPGGWQENVACPENSNPCLPLPDSCETPSVFILTYGLPSYHPYVVIGDQSLTIECALGDELVPRELTLVSPASWSAIASGERITVRWFPATDLTRFPVVVEFAKSEYDFERTVLATTIEDDRLSFELPSGLSSGRYYLQLLTVGPLPATYGCSGVPYRGHIAHSFDQHLIVP